MNIFLLATCRKPELLPWTLLVFRSIRVGFPTASIYVHGNALPDYALQAVESACASHDCKFSNDSPTIHHLFVEELCLTQQEPFALLDTDVCFYESVEDWKFSESLAGWRIPEFQDEFTGARTRARLHTSLLFVDPVMLRQDIAAYEAQFPVTPFNPLVNLFHPLCLPFKSSGYFHDTASLLYHAVGGQAFTDNQLDAYHHTNFGSISDLVLPRLKDKDAMRCARAALLQNPILGKGGWRYQKMHYANRQ